MPGQHLPLFAHHAAGAAGHHTQYSRRYRGDPERQRLGRAEYRERGEPGGGQRGYCCNGAGNAKGFLEDGTLWLPTRDGVVTLDTLDIRTNPVPPPVVAPAGEVPDAPVRVAGAPARSGVSDGWLGRFMLRDNLHSDGLWAALAAEASALARVQSARALVQLQKIDVTLREVRFRYRGTDPRTGQLTEWLDRWEDTRRLPLLVSIEIVPLQHAVAADLVPLITRLVDPATAGTPAAREKA